MDTVLNVCWEWCGYVTSCSAPHTLPLREWHSMWPINVRWCCIPARLKSSSHLQHDVVRDSYNSATIRLELITYIFDSHGMCRDPGPSWPWHTSLWHWRVLDLKMLVLPSQILIDNTVNSLSYARRRTHATRTLSYDGVTSWLLIISTCEYSFTAIADSANIQLAVPSTSTLCRKKLSRLMFDNNFGKCRPIFKSFTRWFVRKCSMYTSQRFPPHLQHVATLPCESWKSKKCYWLWQHLTECWRIPVNTSRTWFNI